MDDLEQILSQLEDLRERASELQRVLGERGYVPTLQGHLLERIELTPESILDITTQSALRAKIRAINRLLGGREEELFETWKEAYLVNPIAREYRIITESLDQIRTYLSAPEARNEP